MKRLYWLTLLTVVIVACNLSSSKQKSADDSLQYYPPTPEAISKDEFRKYYRDLVAHFDTLLPKGEFNGGILIAKNSTGFYHIHSIIHSVQNTIQAPHPDKCEATTALKL